VAAQAAGHRALKLKVGVQTPEQDVVRAHRVATMLEPGACLRLDANGAWSEAAATRVLEGIASLPIEWVEQPVAADALDAMRRLRELGLAPIAADESVTGPEGLARVLETGAADCVVLKPAAVGGPGAALAMADAAEQAGVGRVVTSFLDSGLGVAAALQLAAALPGPLPACGLATGALLTDDLARLDQPQNGRMSLPTEPGIGVSPEPGALQRLGTASALELGP
jgi:L-alanine-DL-glutamate epimerase-like enolase superfamily enzyme